MKRPYWFLLIIPFLLIVAWRFWLPADLSACPADGETAGPLTLVIRGYFERNSRTDWRDMDDRFDILSTPEGQSIASQPTSHACEALRVLQSPAFNQSEKIFTMALMFRLPIDQYMALMDRSHQLYTQGKMDKEVMTLVVFPRGTAINYWWLPNWRQRFSRDAPGLLDANLINDVLSGHYWFEYPGAGF